MFTGDAARGEEPRWAYQTKLVLSQALASFKASICGKWCACISQTSITSGSVLLMCTREPTQIGMASQAHFLPSCEVLLTMLMLMTLIASAGPATSKTQSATGTAKARSSTQGSQANPGTASAQPGSKPVAAAPKSGSKTGAQTGPQRQHQSVQAAGRAAPQTSRAVTPGQSNRSAVMGSKSSPAQRMGVAGATAKASHAVSAVASKAGQVSGRQQSPSNGIGSGRPVISARPGNGAKPGNQNECMLLPFPTMCARG